MNELNEISKIVKTRRKQINMTQISLAKKTGLTQAQIARFENGQTNVRVTTLIKLMKGLGLEMNITTKD